MNYSAAVLTISDKGYRGEREDTSGPAVAAMLKEAGYDVVCTKTLPDERDMIAAELTRLADEEKTALILTTGGTGFSPRDITPEATLDVVERRTPGIPEAMRYASLQITPRGCLSRSEAGIRGRSLIVNLPGSKKAAAENLAAVLSSLEHGLDMLRSEGSADCASAAEANGNSGNTVKICAEGKEPVCEASKADPDDLSEWLREAQNAPDADKCGMYLTHVGVVRSTARAQARNGIASDPVKAMVFSYDENKVRDAELATLAMDGIYYVRTKLNSGTLKVGDPIMQVLVGGDTRPHVIAALEALVETLKTRCVREIEVM